MRKPHIAFVVESAHGHINPTLSVTSALVSYGYRVSYAVKDYFAPRVVASGGQAVIYRPLQVWRALFEQMRKDGRGDFTFDMGRVDWERVKREVSTECDDTVSQLSRLYANDIPELIIYDVSNRAGRSLASKWGIPTIQYTAGMVNIENLDKYHPALVIVSIPEFFQINRAALDNRFHFVGPIYTSQSLFVPWKPATATKMRLLVSGSTGLYLPQVEFFSTVVRAFENTGLNVVLSVGEEFDVSCLPKLPETFEINRVSSQQCILEHSCLFIGQGGPSSIFEALRFGVPLVLAPPSQLHDVYARRVAELGLGLRLLKADLSPDTLRESVLSLLENSAVLDRVKGVQEVLCRTTGAETAASLIHEYFTGSM